MTTAVIRKLSSGGAVFELPTVAPRWFRDWRAAAAEAKALQVPFRLEEPGPAPAVVLASALS